MQSKNFIFLCVCIKWLILAKITYENNDIEVIVDDIGMLWGLNEKHIEGKLCHKNLPVITNKYDPVYKKGKYELVDKPKNNQTECSCAVIQH